jgi:hypothetical protein
MVEVFEAAAKEAKTTGEIAVLAGLSAATARRRITPGLTSAERSSSN